MSVENLGAYNVQGYAPQYVQRVPYQARLGNPYFGQAEADSFEHSGGGLGGGLSYAALGGAAGAGLGYFMFGNPVSEGEEGLKVNERFYQSLDNAELQQEITKKISAAELEKIKAVGVNSKEELDALRKLANAESYEALTDEVKNALPKNVNTPEAANELVQKAETELAKVDRAAISKTVKETFVQEKGSYKEISDQLKNIKSLEEKVGQLADDVKPADLKKFITDNKALFGLKGDEAAVAAEIERLSNLGKSGLLTELGEAKLTGAAKLSALDGKVIANYSKESKSLVAEAPEVLKNAFKDFKWSQAKRFGLWGAATAFGAYVVSSMFGGSNKS